MIHESIRNGYEYGNYCIGHLDGLDCSLLKLDVLKDECSDPEVKDEAATLERRDTGADSE